MCKEIKCVVTCATDVDYYLNEYQNVKKSNGMKFFAPVDNNPEIAQMILNKANNQWRISCQTQKILNLR